MCHINIIAMQDIIILKKAKKKKMMLENIADIIELAKIAQVLSPINFA